MRCVSACVSLVLASTAEPHDGHTGERDPGNALNMTMVDSILLDAVADLYVVDNHAYVGSWRRGSLHVVDISHPQAMRLDTVLTVSDAAALDVKVSGNLAAIGTQGAGDSSGFGGEVVLVDISKPSDPEILSHFSAPGGVHNLFLYRERAYLAHVAIAGLTVLDISDPRQPFASGFWSSDVEGFSSFVHDVFIRDDTAFLSVVNDLGPGTGGLAILDLADPDRPLTLSSLPIVEGLHSAWMEEGLVYCNQESGGWERALHIIDATDPRHPTRMGVFRAEPPPLGEVEGPHNPYIQNHLLYWAYYDAGVRIFDLFTPERPVEIAYFVTRGAWSAQPHTNGLIYVADNGQVFGGLGQSGLLALRFNEPSHAIRQVSLSADSTVVGRTDRITVAATTARSPRGIIGEITRVAARFLSVDQADEWLLFDKGTGGDAAGGDGVYTGHFRVPLGVHSGKHRIQVQLEDDRSRIYPYRLPFHILPVEDLVIFEDVLTDRWQTNRISGVELHVQEDTFAHQGASALAFGNINGAFRVLYELMEPTDPFGYSLRFAFHPGDVAAPSFGDTELNLAVNGKLVRLLNGSREGIALDMNNREWQLVQMPMDFLSLDVITSIGFTGRLQGTFFLDDMRLVAAALPPPATTSVQEEGTPTPLQIFTLEQNYPNPFNSETVIRFALQRPSEIELALHNLAGQKVVQLAQATRGAGVHTVRWNGRDARGRTLASGIYLLRLRAGAQVETRKLALVR